MNKKILIFSSLIILGGIFWAGKQFYSESQSKKIATVVAEDEAALVRDYSPSTGSSLARVTLVEFLDPECEACAAFFPIVKKMIESYEGSVRLVVRYAPFHPNSKFAVKILEASRKQGKYWETMARLFQELPNWGDHHNPKPELIWAYLPSLGLDIDRLKKDMEDDVIMKNMEQDIKDGQKLGVRRTPTFFVNGEPLASFGPQQLQDAIDQELAN